MQNRGLKIIIKQLIRKPQKWIQKHYPYFIRIYKYRLFIDGEPGIGARASILTRSFWRAYVDRRTILFYPDGPLEFHAIYKLLLYLGYRITTDPRKHYDYAIKWWRAFDGNPFVPQAGIKTRLRKGLDSSRSLNATCDDISKERVNAIFDKVFPYSITIDPAVYHGKCVMKSNWNALHEGKIVDCPVEKKNNSIVYQRLINNERADGYIEDMRVPVFKGIIPFIYLKYRSVEDRFVDRKHTGKRAAIAEKDVKLTAQELEKIAEFSEKLGLDYGELDVLRDKADGRIYIVDANNTPSGPTSAISENESRHAVKRMAHTFEQAIGV